MNSGIKKLEAYDLKRVQDFEKKLGCCVVALEPQASKTTTSPAKLNDDQLQDLRTMEGDIGAILVAYKC